MATKQQLMDFFNYLGIIADKAQETYENTSVYNDTREDVFDAKIDAIITAQDIVWFYEDTAHQKFEDKKHRALRLKEAYRKSDNYHDYTYYRIYANYITRCIYAYERITSK